MGCGASTRTMTVLFINESNPPCELVAGNAVEMPSFFPPSGIIKKDNLVTFDDREFIKQSRSTYIEGVAVYVSEVVNGLEINYVIDGALKKLTHGSATGTKHILDMSGDSHINQVDCTWSSTAVNSISFTTSDGKNLKAIGSKGLGNYEKTFNCVDSNRGFVGFKGQHQEHLTCLFVYTWKLVRSYKKPN